jgi:hypothetical protein
MVLGYIGPAQTTSIFDMVQATSAALGLHDINMKSNTQNKQ